MLLGDTRHPARRRSRAGRAPGKGATALALAGLLAGNVGPTLAAPPTPAAHPTQPAPATDASIAIVDGGRVVGQTTPEAAQKDGLMVVDLSDDWLPYVFSEEPGKPQPLRPYLIDLANGRFRGGSQYARAREDRFFEAFGIFPSLNLLRRRLADKKRHACHQRVKDSVLEELSAKNVIPAEEAEKVPNPNTAAVAAGEAPAMIPTGKTVSPRPLTPTEKRAVIAMQGHLRCEDLLPGKAIAGRMDRRTSEGLKTYQHLQMLADNANMDFETRQALLGDSREQDFRGLLRALRARVVDVTGLIEDGSALGSQGQVQGRTIDTAEFQPLSAPPGAAKPNPSVSVPSKPDTALAANQSPPVEKAPAANPPAPIGSVEPSAKIVPAPDLIATATQAASQALGWTSPDAVLASTLVAAPPASRRPARKAAKLKGPVPLPAAVAIRLPPPPPYHSANMELRAEIDRGEVDLVRPKLDKDGHKKWKPPVADRPTITLFAHVGDHDVALCRWPTTIGGWKMFQKSDGTMALKYKESVTGDALWTEVLATPTWHPAPGMPTSHLLIKVGDTFMPKTEIIGPGYHAAYGLVAMVHKQIMGVTEGGEPDLMDLRIRTHGTPGYRTVKRGESNGCHRLHNYEALRLAAFLVKHHANTRDGLVPEDYERHLQYKGQDIALQSDSKGYRFKLTPPVPVKVLGGDIHGNAKAVKHMVPVSAVP